MKYIISRDKYLLEKIVWLENKQEKWEQRFSKLIMSFHDSINDMIEDIKDRYNDRDDPDEVHTAYMEHFERAFDNLVEEIRNVDEDEYLYKLWNELVLNFSLWKESFSKMSEKLDNYNSIFKLGYEMFDRIGTYITKAISKEYYDGLKGEMDDKRENSIKFIEKFYDNVKIRLDDVDAEDIFSMSNLDEKNTDEISMDAGDEVRYYKNDEEENIALISHNQEDLKEPDNIRLVSKTDGDQFEIDKSELIEIIPKHKTKNQEVSDKLRSVKSDPDKLDKLNDFLDKLTIDADTNESLDWTNQEEEMDAIITEYQTKLWLSDHQFKRIHINLIDTMLKEVYKPVGHWKKYQFWGVMDLPWETSKWSILNKINTNYIALTVLINELNRALKQGKSDVEIFNFGDKQFGSQKFYGEYYRMMNFIDKNKVKILLKLDENTGSKMINQIVEKIEKTSGVGDKAEKKVSEYLPKLFPDNKISDIEIPSGGGEKQDMTGGIDITFKLDGHPKTMQVKKCRSIIKGSDDKYRISGTSVSDHYTVNYITCVSYYNMAIFNYDQSSIELLTNGDLKINENLLIKNIKLK